MNIQSVNSLVSEKTDPSNFMIIGRRSHGGSASGNSIAGYLSVVKSGVPVVLEVRSSGGGKLIVTDKDYHSKKIAAWSGISHKGKYIYRLKPEEADKTLQGTGVSSHLLDEVIHRVEKFTLWNNLKPAEYIIDLDTDPEKEGFILPVPEELVLKTIDIVRMRRIGMRTTIQSNDVRPLKCFRRLDNNLRIALMANPELQVNDNIYPLGFIPDIYSVDYRYVTKMLIRSVREKGMLFIAYVVNDLADINELRQMGVNGIITDHPDLALLLLH